MSKVKKGEDEFTLESHAERIHGVITDEGEGYRSMVGRHMGPLAYVELPVGHPDADKRCSELDPEVKYTKHRKPDTRPGKHLCPWCGRRGQQRHSKRAYCAHCRCSFEV